MKGCEGYILIESKWFQSTKSLELTGTLPTQVPHQGCSGLTRGVTAALKPAAEIILPKKPLDTSLQ